MENQTMWKGIRTKSQIIRIKLLEMKIECKE